MISKKSNKLGMLSVIMAGLSTTSIMSAPTFGRSDMFYNTESKKQYINSVNSSKPNKRRLKVKLARKANVQRLIKMK